MPVAEAVIEITAVVTACRAAPPAPRKARDGIESPSVTVVSAEGQRVVP
jgi:hypothetical protein